MKRKNIIVSLVILFMPTIFLYQIPPLGLLSSLTEGRVTSETEKQR